MPKANVRDVKEIINNYYYFSVLLWKRLEVLFDKPPTMSLYYLFTHIIRK